MDNLFSREGLLAAAQMVLSGGDTVVSYVRTFEEIPNGCSLLKIVVDPSGKGGTVPGDVTVHTIKKVPQTLSGGELADAVGAAVLTHLQGKPDGLALMLKANCSMFDAGVGLAVALMRSGIMKTERSRDYYRGPQRVVVMIESDEFVFDSGQFTKGLEMGRLLNLQRWLGGLPPNVLTPRTFAALIDDLVSWWPCGDVKVEVIDMPVGAMSALQEVGRAAKVKPEARCFRVDPMDGRTSKVRVLVGKGVTIDEGGASLKVDNHMVGMNADMMGAAAVVVTLLWALKHRVRESTVFTVGLVENRIGGGYTVGDIIRGYDGTTIEIMNTDAEGRLVLFDCVAVMCDMFKGSISRLMTIATLTGHAGVAVGENVGTYMMAGTRLENLKDRVLLRRRRSGDPIQVLDLTDEHRKALLSDRADFRNADNLRPMGTQKGATFIGLAAERESIPLIEYHDIARCGRNSGDPERGQATGLPPYGGVHLAISMITDTPDD